MGERPERFTYGSGCTVCAQTGYQGRSGVYELLTMSDAIKQMYIDGDPRDKLYQQALTEGLVPLRRGGMQKVQQGSTTPYEVMRVLFTL